MKTVFYIFQKGHWMHINQLGLGINLKTLWKCKKRKSFEDITTAADAAVVF